MIIHISTRDLTARRSTASVIQSDSAQAQTSYVRSVWVHSRDQPLPIFDMDYGVLQNISTTYKSDPTPAPDFRLKLLLLLLLLVLG